MMGPSDSRSEEIFLKWSSRTACSLRKDRQQHEMCETVDACKDDLHGQNMRCGLQHQHI